MNYYKPPHLRLILKLLFMSRYESGDTRLSSTILINELFILTFMVVVESVRLVLGQKHELVRQLNSHGVYLLNDFLLNQIPTSKYSLCSTNLLLSFQDDFEKSLSNVFRILVLTVPSMHSVAYFTLWQNIVTRLDMVLGGIMLVIQVKKSISKNI